MSKSTINSATPKRPASKAARSKSGKARTATLRAAVDEKGCPMQIDRYYSFKFPRHNFHGVPSKMETRQFRCDSIRDLVQQPIERLTNEIQPLLRRGRFLVTGLDLDKQEERSFYVESMRDVVEIEPPPNDRTALTIYVVQRQICTTEESAFEAALAGASLTKESVPIEVIQIARTLPRSVFRIVEPIEDRVASLKHQGRTQKTR
jgi:hypothetical protein